MGSKPRKGKSRKPALPKTVLNPPRAATAGNADASKADRYRLGREIGRGGLGRVVEAADAPIGRTVALKLLLEGAPLDLVERFHREGRITGRLEHPNIVPVHEVGELPGTGEIFIAMKRITGRDMADVIADLRRGKAGEWTQRKLVEAFRDSCRAVAYAHSKGVIHRDLKPSNVMLGEFGEVLVVDWGLAKDLREKETAGGSGGIDAHEPLLTLDGDIFGTPEYMPPEQAEGRVQDVDERSDVYSLGAILYEILAWRPPHTGDSAREILSRAASEPVRAPSTVVGPPGAVPAPRRKSDAHPPPVPPDLEAVCMKALARERGSRFADAAVLAREIDLWLEGTRERERREAEAAREVAKAREKLARWREAVAAHEAAQRDAEVLEERIPTHEGPAKKRELWRAQDRAEALEAESLRQLADAEMALSAALEAVPGHREARAMKAELYWEEAQAADQKGEGATAARRRQMAEAYNDGVLDVRLRGVGTLEIRTRAYGCPCLSRGRDVAPADLLVLGVQPWSGREPASPWQVNLPDLEPAEAVNLRVHSAGCRPVALAGADVWAWRYHEEDRLMIPVTEGPSKSPVPPEVLDALFGDSPFRPRGGGEWLGRTPLPPRPRAMGSWLLVVASEGRRPVRVPVNVGRLENAAVDVTLFTPEEWPGEEFEFVAGGRFQYQGDFKDVFSEPLQVREVDDFFVARFPVRRREYDSFLERVEAGSPGFAQKYAPRVAVREAGPDHPVLGVRWTDAQAYAYHESRRLGRLLCLPHDLLREKCGRGTDGRFFPWGSRFDHAFCSNNRALAGVMRPVEAGAFRTDESPYGIRDLAGNARDWCLNGVEKPNQPEWRCVRGGIWNGPVTLCRCVYRAGAPQENTTDGMSFRLAAPVRLGGAVR